MIRLRHLSLGIFIVFCALGATAQNGRISGLVEESNASVPFATVQLRPGNIGTFTDLEGRFLFENLIAGTYELLVSAIGYDPQKLTVTVQENNTTRVDINLTAGNTVLGEVVVTGTMREMTVLQSPVKTEVLTAEFLHSSPTYNVVEALNFVNGVQEVINCGVCGTNDIHINGMEGAYTLLLIDGMPIMSSLASIYGFNGIPNALIERVEIIKGPSSTLYGTEAVGGVINVITKSPSNLPLLSAGLSYSTHDELDMDMVISPTVSDKAKTMLSANYFRNAYRMDFNNDNFTDVPLSERISLFNKWEFSNDNRKWGSLAGRYYSENRFGGVLNWQMEDAGSDSIYGEFINTNRIEVIGNLKLPLRWLSLDFSANSHVQDSYYGTTRYMAEQRVGFLNLIAQQEFNRHFVTAGATQRYQTYADNSLASSDEKRYIPGFFVQDEFMANEWLTVLAGSRLDHHSAHGWIYSPRINIKASTSAYSTFRLNAGSGFRVVNLFTEDHAALTGARQIIIAEKLEPEESWNVNLNYNRVYSLGQLGYGIIDADVFHTWFSNKIVPDYSVDPNLIVYENLTGQGISRGASLSLTHTFSTKSEFSVAGTYLNVYEVWSDAEKENQLLTPTLSAKMRYKWQSPWWDIAVNYSALITGPMHLPQYEGEFSRSATSSTFSLHHIKFSREFKNWEVYLGIKNIFNYTQESPLVDPANPFGTNFDTAYAYGPLQTRRYMLGASFKIDRKP